MNEADEYELIQYVMKDRERMRDRIESLRGLVKWCSGRLLDANDVESANEAMRLVGDMEPKL